MLFLVHSYICTDVAIAARKAFFKKYARRSLFARKPTYVHAYKMCKGNAAIIIIVCINCSSTSIQCILAVYVTVHGKRGLAQFITLWENSVWNSRIFELVFLRLGTSYTSAVNVTGKPIHWALNGCHEQDSAPPNSDARSCFWWAI